MWTYIFYTAEEGSRSSVECLLRKHGIDANRLHKPVDFEPRRWELNTEYPLGEEVLDEFRPINNSDMAGFTRVETKDGNNAAYKLHI